MRVGWLAQGKHADSPYQGLGSRPDRQISRWLRQQALPVLQPSHLRDAKPPHKLSQAARKATALAAKSSTQTTSHLNSSSSTRIVVVDTLNFLEYFFPALHQPDRKKRDPWAVLGSMLRRVRGFMEAAKESGIEPIFVIDAGWSSDEVRDKWKSRRNSEVLHKNKRVIAGLDVLMVEALEAAGAKVFTPAGQDADDIIVLLAHNAGPESLILSFDADMYRYNLPGAADRIKDTLMFIEKKVKGGPATYTLDLHRVRETLDPTKPGKERSLEMLLDTVPWEPDRWLVHESEIVQAAEKQTYIRGACSSYVREFGNLHGHLMPLRQAVYKQLGISHDVKEVYPEWDNESQSVLWINELVSPTTKALPPSVAGALSGSYEELGMEAMRWLESVDPSAKESGNGESLERQFARCSLVADLLCALYPDLSKFKVIEMLSGRAVEESDSGADWPPAEMGTRCAEHGCCEVFFTSAHERKWYISKGFSLPKRCPKCRKKRGQKN
mmetsp:Transcript_98/g.318  ORF Transcript_98/g.318 Transcript_98/m.318 type:complete len:497 (+) Transcript_98:213-1703(+)